jgi:hypothetical protein
MQAANSSPVGPGAKQRTTSTSEEHSVMDPVANVVSALVFNHANMFSRIQ